MCGTITLKPRLKFFEILFFSSFNTNTRFISLVFKPIKIGGTPYYLTLELR